MPVRLGAVLTSSARSASSRTRRSSRCRRRSSREGLRRRSRSNSPRSWPPRSRSWLPRSWFGPRSGSGCRGRGRGLRRDRGCGRVGRCPARAPRFARRRSRPARRRSRRRSTPALRSSERAAHGSASPRRRWSTPPRSHRSAAPSEASARPRRPSSGRSAAARAGASSRGFHGPWWCPSGGCLSFELGIEVLPIGEEPIQSEVGHRVLHELREDVERHGRDVGTCEG